MRGDGDTGPTTPRGRSTRKILPSAPGAPVKKKSSAASTKGALKPKRLVYNDDNETEEGTQDASDSSDAIQEMEQLFEARISTVEGVWVQCDNLDCEKWRYLADVIDPSELPEKWYCFMNSDLNHNSCDAEEDSPPEDDLLETKFFVGSIVWAKVATYPWWPAMVDDDPDLGVYEWREHNHGLPTSYHVTFLDQNVTRAWVRDALCMPFRQAKHHDGPAGNKIPGFYRKMFDAATATAEVALKMPVSERIKSYCFLNKYRGTRKNVVQAPKERRPRGRPRKNTQPVAQPSKDAALAKPRQGTKRPLAQLHTNCKENAQAEQPPLKQLKETTTKKGKTTPCGKPQKVDPLSTIATAHVVSSQANQAVKQPKGRPRKNADAETDQPLDLSQKKPKASSKKALERKHDNTESGGLKNASAKPAASAKGSLKQPARRKLSAILTKRMIDEAKQALTREKESNTNQNTTASSDPKPTTASSNTKEIVCDAAVTVCQMKSECKTDEGDTGAPSEKSVFTSSSDHESSDSQGATAFLQPTKEPDFVFKTPTIQNRIKKRQSSAVGSKVSPPNVADSDNVNLRTDTETTCTSVDNAIAQAEAYGHESPNEPLASDAKLFMTQHKASQPTALDSTDAGLVLTIPSFDSIEAQNECFDVSSLIEFLDIDDKTDNNRMFGTLNKAGQSRSYQLQLPCDPIDLEPPMDMLPVEVDIPGCGSNGKSQLQQTELELGTVSAAALAKQPMPTANSETEVHVMVLAEMGLQSSRRAKLPNKVSLGATDAETSSKVSTPAYKPPSMSRGELDKFGNSEDTAAGVQSNSGGSTETGMCKKANKVKGAAVAANKKNHKPPSATAQTEASAKKGKTASKENRAPHNEMMPPKAPLAKKHTFKVPTREVTSKTEASVSKTAAPLNGTQPRANLSNSAETKLPASLTNRNVSPSNVIEAASKARAEVDNNGTHCKTGTGKAAEGNVQAVPSRISGAQSKASGSTSADKNKQALPENTRETQPKPSHGYLVDSEDSDFESLSNTQDLTFEDTLSSISQSMEMGREDSDFASLEGIDGSQPFDMEE
ncbi:uncharacterized protein LOC119161779 [Rhipicephalus microplus]|uniref:uncharacterized protein LOC119161779 n=1 Tax=Rhipicephalus microplus TaxID=6941 RepID=UPI003F6BF3BB